MLTKDVRQIEIIFTNKRLKILNSQNDNKHTRQQIITNLNVTLNVLVLELTIFFILIIFIILTSKFCVAIPNSRADTPTNCGNISIITSMALALMK